MNNKIQSAKDNIIARGLKECADVLHRKDIEKYINGKYFFSGCRKGFKLCENIICIEQLEAFLIHYFREENEIVQQLQKNIQFSHVISNDSKSVKKLANIRGIRCAINYIYDTLNLLIMEKK